MLTLQEGVKQLFSNDPGKLYFLTGSEYGVKAQYLKQLSEHYNDNVEEYPSFDDLMQTFSSKSLLPRTPSLYIIRYDQNFIKSLNLDLVSNVLKLNIVGTAIGIYKESKDEEKLDKFFPDNTLRINTLAPNIMKKHLSKIYTKIPEMYIDAIVEISVDFYEALHICYRLNLLSLSDISSISIKDIKNIFKCYDLADTSRFKEAIAARNFVVAIEEIEKYDGDINNLFYEILNVLLEIIKVLEKRYVESYVSKYLSLWNLHTAKFMFNICYEQIIKCRNISTYPPEIALIYICSLLQFKVG